MTYPTPFTLEDNVLTVEGRRLKMKGTEFVKQIVKPLVRQGHTTLTVRSTYRIVDPKRTVLDGRQTALLRAHGVAYIMTRFAARKHGGRKRQAHLNRVKRLLQAGWSQSAIARDLGVSQAAVSKARDMILLNAHKKGETITLPRRGRSVMSEFPSKRV